MEGDGIGPIASGCLHSVFMHPPGMNVVAPMTPKEYQNVWNDFYKNDLPFFVSEHRSSYSISEEMPNIINSNSKITIMAISASRINALEALEELAQEGLECDIFHIVNLKPFEISDQLIKSLNNTNLGIVIDTDYETCGASQSIAYELMLKSNAKIYGYGLEDRVSGVSKKSENITPSKFKIKDKIKSLLR
jgi:pyruvate dehydrogenase E1 component beta subunit